MIELLDEIEARCKAATELECFPWDDNPSNNNSWCDGEKATKLLKTARTDIPALCKALRLVIDHVDCVINAAIDVNEARAVSKLVIKEAAAILKGE